MPVDHMAGHLAIGLGIVPQHPQAFRADADGGLTVLSGKALGLCDGDIAETGGFDGEVESAFTGDLRPHEIHAAEKNPRPAG